jgi:glycosyltransferase involved in cell wall biosynthesis
VARLAYVSPLPPARTGIATYSQAVIDQLDEIGVAERHRLEPVWPLGPRAEEIVRRADLAVYHLGNNAEFHGEIYRLAVRQPGLVVLHDLALDDLARWFLDQGDPLGDRTEAEAEGAREGLVLARPELEGPLEVPWCAYAARRARGVVVHSDFGRGYLHALGSRTPVFVIPHPIIDPPLAARRAHRRARSIREGLIERVLIGVLGDLGAAKGIETVLAVVARLDAPVHVALVGRRIPGYDVQEAVRESGLADRVTVASDVSDRDFYAWLEASDVVVNLRHPHRGEVSGTLVRAMAEGKPVAVPATGSYLDWPSEAVVLVPAGPPDPEALARALEPLVRDPDHRAAIGRRAAAHARRLRRGRATARGYRHAIEATLALVRDPARQGAERWAGSLASMGATEQEAPLALGPVAALQEVAGADVPGVT